MKDKDCWFDNYCTLDLECESCKRSGLHFLVDKVYIDKTLIPNRYLRVKFSDLKVDNSTLPVVIYYSDLWHKVLKGEGLYLHSPITGNGKTSLACVCLLRYLAKSVMVDPNDFDNRRVLYINTCEFLERIKASFNNPDPLLDRLFEELTDKSMAPKLMLFDDIGSEKSTPFAIGKLYTLINFRSANELATIFTSNLNIKQLEEIMGPRIASRIRGMCNLVELMGPDRRSL